MSYVRFDDEHEGGQLSQFRERLSAEVRVQTGEEFPIFQDRNDILWGQNWKSRIEETLDAVTLLIPIITPNFFRSPPCRDEVHRFLDRERQLGREDLVLPVYYVSAAEFDDAALREADDMASVLSLRQYADWRELRFEPMTAPVVRRAVAHLASRLRDTFWRPRVPVPATAPTRSQQPNVAQPASRPDEAIASDDRSGSRRQEPPTRVVDAFGRADHLSIREAIQAAEPGDRILVRPGLYTEGLVIDKPLEVLGDGPLGDVVVQASGQNVLLFKANIGRVANLTLRQSGGPEQWNGVDIVQGRLELEGCDISSQSLSCVVIRSGADPRLRANRIFGSTEAGVHVLDDGLGTLEDNDITGNTLAGVEIKTGGNPTLRRNQIHENRESGVFVHTDGLGTLEDNEISGNRLSGVTIKAGGNPTLRGNRIHHNKENGVFVHTDGLGTLDGNEISGNQLSGVEIKTGGNPTVRRNQIRENNQAGVFVQDSGLGVMEDNDITGSTLSGVVVKTGGNPTLRRNQIHDNQENGVFVHSDGLGNLDGNEITDNAGAGVTIKTGGSPTLRRNQINRNKYQAVFVFEGGRGIVEDNDLTDNVRGAWSVAAESRTTLQRSGNRE